MTQTPKEVIEEFLAADRKMADRFNADFAWRQPGIEDRLEFVDSRLRNTITALCLIAEIVSTTPTSSGESP